MKYTCFVVEHNPQYACEDEPIKTIELTSKQFVILDFPKVCNDTSSTCAATSIETQLDGTILNLPNKIVIGQFLALRFYEENGYLFSNIDNLIKY